MKDCKKFFRGIWMCVLICLVFAGMPAVADAKTKTATSPGIAYKSGKYIYYAANTENAHKSGIMRYNTKTGKKKLIVDNWTKNKVGNGFYDITVKGKYIYATWNKGTDGYTDATYIYRFSKNGKTKKKLATGRSPIVVGKYIYYIEGTLADNKRDTRDTGNLCRMKLNGKGKKKIIKNKGESYFRELYSYGSTFLYSDNYTEESLFTKKGAKKTKAKLQISENNLYRVGNFEYYTNGTDVQPASIIYRKDLRDGSEKVVAEYTQIENFMVCGKYIMIKATENRQSVIYCFDTSKGTKKRLARWSLAE